MAFITGGTVDRGRPTAFESVKAVSFESLNITGMPATCIDNNGGSITIAIILRDMSRPRRLWRYVSRPSRFLLGELTSNLVVVADLTLDVTWCNLCNLQRKCESAENPKADALPC
ncbi:hypothetical protein Baya_5921 [Bagarius yarrelli]|uniref:Uncharacterized protein n=1 Tax=Bagarius yarrelli TaxID=175774 RepID=A0A556TXX4_BAGYA|nr:hypothetical protein Baya_5921 [Bagarius yarrelli]